ncbi:hypothetical protein [Polyangium spumosum]|uniref:Lipoprotein n=1 Tax=Polyangium spumosum TaxID=889282 RepID=A0A6N7Q4S8_9BACT|nr:hypothetical protein [Polyangium spumosum]MRG97890.1 hypothetical protein [Polyangium spumosum]
MQRMRLGFVGIVALVFAGLGACGGKVVIDAEGNGGDDGVGGAGAGGAGGVGAGEPMTTSVSVGGSVTCNGPILSGNDDSCQLVAECSNGSTLNTACFPTSDSTASCKCSVDGVSVGSCTGANSSGAPACSATEGCCAQFFF